MVDLVTRLPRLFRVAWYAVVALTVLIAILLSAVRIVTPMINKEAVSWLNWLNHSLPVTVEADTFHASWHGFWPEFDLTKVRIWDKAHTQVIMAADEATLAINPYRSWWRGYMVPHRVRLAGFTTQVQEDINGHFQIVGLTLPTQNTDTLTELEQIILNNGSSFELKNSHIDWHRPTGPVIKIQNLQGSIVNAGRRHQISVTAKIQQKTSTTFEAALDFWGMPNTDDFIGNAYIKANPVVLQDWYTPVRLGAVTLTQANGNGEFWFGWKEKQFTYVTTRLGWQGLQLSIANVPLADRITAVTGDLFWHKEDVNTYRIVGHDLHVIMNAKDNKSKTLLSAAHQADVTLSPLTFQLVLTPIEKQTLPQILLAMDVLNLQELQGLIQQGVFKNKDIPQLEPLSNTFMQFKPTGQLQHILLQYNPVTQQFAVDGAFSHLNIAKVQTWPGLTNVSGGLHITPDSGWLALASKTSQLDFGNLFLGPLVLDKLQGKAIWHRDGTQWQIQLQNVLAQQGASIAKAEMALQIPLDSKQSPNIDLVANVTDMAAKQVLQDLPMGVFSPALVTWLRRSIEAGTAKNTNIQVRGPLRDFPFANHTGNFEINFDLDKGRLRYLPQWPLISNINAHARFIGEAMEIKVAHANIFNAEVYNTDVDIPVIRKDVPAVLKVAGNVRGNVAEGIQFLQQSPLWQTLGRHLTALKANGPMVLTLGLTVPLEDGGPKLDVSGNINLQKTNVSVLQQAIHIDNLQGDIAFTDEGLTSRNLVGQLWESPVSIKMQTTHENKLPLTLVTLEGHVSTDVLRKEFPNKWWDKVQGSTSYVAQIHLQDSRATRPSVVTVKSDLKGISIALPSSYAKASTDPAQLTIDVSLAISEIQLQLGLKNASSVLLFKQKKLDKGMLRFGDNKPAALPNGSGLQIVGTLDKVVAADWMQFLSKDNAQNEALTAFPIRSVDLDIQTLEILGRTLQSARIQAARNPPYWLMNVTSQQWRGQIWLPDNFSKQAMIINMQTCDLQTGDNTKSTSFTLAQLKAIPPLEVHCKQVIRDGQDLGNATIKTSPSKQGLTINQMVLVSPVYTLKLSGAWRGDTKTVTEINGSIDSRNIASSLARLKMKSNLQGSQGVVNFNLSWPGAPMDAGLRTLSGKVNINFVHGHLLGVEPGFGRLLSVLSLETFVRRLKLDFSDLFSQGFSVDSIKANFDLSNGVAYTPRLVVTGPVATIHLQGRTNLVRRDYDFTVNVTPHVTASLPLAATIASGNPLVGAAVWLADKALFTREFKKLSRYDYRVTGTWDKPVVKSLSDAGG